MALKESKNCIFGQEIRISGYRKICTFGVTNSWKTVYFQFCGPLDMKGAFIFIAYYHNKRVLPFPLFSF